MKRPCSECPFRRLSAPGYLGEASFRPREFLGPHWHGEARLPCHMQVDWTAPDAQKQAQEAPLCKGLLIMAKNACKRLDNAEAAAAKDETEADPDLVFRFESEFHQHHQEIRPMAWSSNQRLVESGLLNPNSISAFRAGYADGFQGAEMWAGNDRDFQPGAYRAGYTAGAGDSPNKPKT